MKIIASKNISIKEETYKKLVNMKQNNESFTDIIEKLIDLSKMTNQNIKQFFGAFKSNPFMEIEDVKSNRDEVNKSLEKRLRVV